MDEKRKLVMEFLKSHKLSEAWLIDQLDRQYGIKIGTSTMSLALTGGRESDRYGDLVNRSLFIVEEYANWSNAQRCDERIE